MNIKHKNDDRVVPNACKQIAFEIYDPKGKKLLFECTNKVNIFGFSLKNSDDNVEICNKAKAV